MQTFDKELLFNYTPNAKVYSKALEITEKLGKLSVRMSSLFKDYKKASRIFAFIESKYSSKIEGIYTTLFDVVNTGATTKQEKIIKPLVDELLKSKNSISVEKIKEIASVINTGIDQEKRWEPEFGIYKTHNDKKVKIYEPLKDKKQVDILLTEIVKKSNEDKTIIDMFYTHIIFEKIHPFVDANGRLGRLLLQKSLSHLMNFSNVVPLSWAFFKNLSKYYEAFDIYQKEDLNTSIIKLLEITEKMYESTKTFIMNLDVYYKKYINIILNSSFKVNLEIAEDILLTLQTKRNYIERQYKLNPRTIDSIFEKISDELPFNFRRVKRNVLYWNVTLEEEAEKIFN